MSKEIAAALAVAFNDLSDFTITASVAERILDRMADRGFVVVPSKPSSGLLVSMAMRYAHDFGLDRQENSSFVSGYTPAARASLLGTMTQLHQEIVGKGFYHRDREATYVASVAVEWDHV